MGRVQRPSPAHRRAAPRPLLTPATRGARPTRRQPSWPILFAAAALAGFGVFGFLVARATRFEPATPGAAAGRLEAARAAFGDAAPVLERNAPGRLVRRGQATAAPAPQPARQLVVLAYRRDLGQLVRAEVPLWFLELKGPVVALAARGTGVDLRQLGLTPEELRRAGPALLLDEGRPDGDRVLVWTE